MRKGLNISKVLITMLLALTVFPVQAQFRYEWLTTSNGLSQGYIYDIIQDQDGFMWFGTKDGLNRYDGYTFKVYTHDNYNPKSLSNNNINKLFEDSKGRIWVATDDGLNIYDKKKDHFIRLMHDPQNENSLSGNKIWIPIVEIGDGRFLVLSEEKSLNVITIPAGFPNSVVQPTVVRLSVPEAISHIYKDGKGKIWMTGLSTLYEFNANNGTFSRSRKDISFGQASTYAAGETWTNDKFFSKIEDTTLFPLFSKDIVNGHGMAFFVEKDNNRFWLGIYDVLKLQIYDIRNWEKGKPFDPEQRKIYDDSGITATKFYKDRSGIMWVGTNGYGIRKYFVDGDKFHHLIPGLSVRRIGGLENKEIWVKGWGEFRRFNLDGKVLTSRDDNRIFNSGTYHYDLLLEKDNTIWGIRRLNKEAVDADNEVLEKINPLTNSVTTYRIKADKSYALTEVRLKDSKANIWLTGLGGIIVVFNPQTGENKKFTIDTDPLNPMLKGAPITSLYEDSEGIFWAGTESGLARIDFDPSLNISTKVTWFRTNQNKNTSLNYNVISNMVSDAFDKNILWVATKGGGLNRLNKSTNQFTHITTKEGLSNNVVYGVLSDNVGNIWGSTNNGIFCILINDSTQNKTNWQFRHFTKIAGLQDDEFNTGAYAKLPNGYLAFGGINGINVFDPAVVLQNGFSPNVFITKIMTGNDVVLPNDGTGILEESIEHSPSITLNHLQDILTLEFSSLDFTAPNQNRYRYQLVGVDKDWVESGTRRTATYLHLPAGTYTFKVQGSNSQYIWSDKVSELRIKVLPPWWRTWWAYLLYAAMIVLAIITYFRFTLKRAKLQQQLTFEQREAKRIKDLDVLKTQLYTNITHEFRTPITVILGMAQQVKNEPEKHLGRGVDMIVRNGEHLLKLVNELLDLSKLESGKMTLNLESGDVINFLRYIVESFQSLAASQQKQFHFLSESDELVVSYDAEKLRQIITNLLSNALKFTPAQGNVYVTISQISSSDYSVLTLKVKDTGIGIPEDQIQHIFDRFYQLDNSQTRKAEGTGIGLALTKELVKLMNGTITVKSPAVGATKGTEFTITIPLKKSNVDSQNSSLSSTNLQSVKKKSVVPLEDLGYINGNKSAKTPLILLVEDNVDVVAYTASCLPDYKLAVGKDGKEGFDIAIEIVPDLIITDVMMPFVDGFEMCRKLRLDERTSHIPIIMLTAKADIQSKLEGLEKGADAYLEKPFNKEELLLRIRKLLEQRKTLQNYYGKQIGITDTNETPITEDQPVVDEKAENEFVKKVRGIVEANFSNYEFTVEQLCKLIFMSHSQLHRKLEALTGCSPNKFIRIVRLNKAKELLKTSEESISSVALDCGYNDPGYFARVFKQEFGLAPQEWRAKAKI